MDRNARFPEFVYPLLAQLDIACEMANSVYPSKHRAAIILCDNLIELVAHRIGHHILSSFLMHERLDQQWARIDLEGAPEEVKQMARSRLNRHTWDDWDNARGQRFEAKLKFLKKEGKITEVEQAYLLQMHAYRSDLYHKGLRWEAALQTLALHFHEFACQFLSRMDMPWLVYAGANYRPGENDELCEEIEKGGWQSITGAFAQRRKDHSGEAESLCDYLDALIVAIDEQLAFVAEVQPDGQSELDALNWATLMALVPEEDLVRNPVQTHGELIERARKKGAKLFSYDPRPSLKKRVQALRAEKDKLKLVVNFGRLHREIEKIGAATRDAAQAADEWVESEVDRMRGK